MDASAQKASDLLVRPGTRGEFCPGRGGFYLWFHPSFGGGLLQLHINRERRTIENQANITMDKGHGSMQASNGKGSQGVEIIRETGSCLVFPVSDPSLRNDDDGGGLLSPGGNAVCGGCRL